MTKDESMSLAVFQTFLLSHEQLLNSPVVNTKSSSFALHAQKMNQKSALVLKSKRQPIHPHKKFFNIVGTSPQGKPNSSQLFQDTNRPPCQICGKSNHQALDYFHWMDYAYQGRHPPNELAAMVSQSNAFRGEDD